MPTAPKRFGATKKRKRVDRRKSSTKRGYGYQWEKYSRQYRRDNPMCAKCEHPADCVDHIQPITGPDDPLFWIEENHQPLCTTCHSKKTATEKNGIQIGRNDYRAT